MFTKPSILLLFFREVTKIMARSTRTTPTTVTVIPTKVPLPRPSDDVVGV